MAGYRKMEGSVESLSVKTFEERSKELDQRLHQLLAEQNLQTEERLLTEKAESNARLVAAMVNQNKQNEEMFKNMMENHEREIRVIMEAQVASQSAQVQMLCKKMEEQNLQTEERLLTEKAERNPRLAKSIPND